MSHHPFAHAARLMYALLVLSLLVLALALAPSPASYAAPPASHPIKIGDARSLPLGSNVTVQGSVMVPSGTFSSSAPDEGFAIQDHIGGIYVSIATNLGLGLRTEVRVTGQLADSTGLLILVVTSPDDVKPLGNGPTVPPQPVATGAVGEDTEGLPVSVVGATSEPVVNDLPYGYYLAMDDGSGAVRVYVPDATGIDIHHSPLLPPRPVTLSTHLLPLVGRAEDRDPPQPCRAKEIALMLVSLMSFD